MNNLLNELNIYIYLFTNVLGIQILNTLFYFLNNIYVVLFTIIFHYFLTVSVHFNSPQGNTVLYFFPYNYSEIYYNINI